jgi:hypothetical protein
MLGKPVQALLVTRPTSRFAPIASGESCKAEAFYKKLMGKNTPYDRHGGAVGHSALDTL